MYLLLIKTNPAKPKKHISTFIFFGLSFNVMLNLIDFVSLLVKFEIPILPITATAGAKTSNSLTMTDAK